MNYQDKNIQALLSNETLLMKRVNDLELRMTTQENNAAIIKAELINSKQLVAHLSGRGMGSTVHD
jgi:cystathionine beta-lyase/cystathionine gamma-synthase